MPRAAGADDRQAGLLERPGDRVEDGHQDRDQRQRDHQADEQQVPAAGGRVGRDRHGHQPQDGRAQDEAEDEQDPTERRPAEDEHGDAGHGIERDPLGGEGQPQQDADHRQHDPERPRTAPATGPQRSEQGVRGDDEQPDVDVVHGDPALDEEHPVDQDEEAGQHRHIAATEQGPDQEEDQARHQGPGHDPGQAPGEGVAAGVDRCQRPVRGRDQDGLAIAARMGRVGVEGPRPGRERQPRVGVDRVGVRLDDVDRVARAIRCRAEQMDHAGRLVVEHPADVAGNPERRRQVRARLAIRLADLDDRYPLVGEGHVHGRLVDPGHLGHAPSGRVELDRVDDLARSPATRTTPRSHR